MLLLERVPYFQSIDPNDDAHLLGLDYNKKGLDKPKASITVGGVKQSQVFYTPLIYMDDPLDETIFRTAIEIIFADVLDVNNILTQLEIVVNIYNEDETIAYTKTEYQPIYNIEEFMMKRYKRAYTYLRNAAKGTPVETLVNTVLDHYSGEVQQWLLGNPQIFIDAINNETDSTMLGYHAIVVWPDGKTMKDALIEQLTAIPFSSGS